MLMLMQRRSKSWEIMVALLTCNCVGRTRNSFECRCKMSAQCDCSGECGAGGDTRKKKNLRVC
jgi:hypothetical protein